MTGDDRTAVRHVLVADRVWDGTAAQPIDRGFVAVEEGRIASVGRAADLPEDAAVRDLGDATVLPGLINAHVHITFNATPTVVADYLHEKDAGFDALMDRARDNLGRAVDVGVTTVRDLGTLNEVVFAAQSQIRDGRLRGPDIVAAGEGITSPGGHCYFFGIECEGEEAMRAAVRRQHDAGANAIKVFATGGNLTPGSDPLAPQFSLEEICALTDEARGLGLSVASHAQGVEGIRRSVTARVNTVEHCSWGTPQGPALDERTAEEMAAEGIAAAPTVGSSILNYLADPSLLESFPDDLRPRIERLMSAYPKMTANVARMREIGVTIITGTDAGIPNRRFDDFAADIQAYTNEQYGVGMQPRDVLIAATSDCASTLGLNDRGILIPGKRADILAVSGDPLTEISDLARTKLVMVAGKIA